MRLSIATSAFCILTTTTITCDAFIVQSKPFSRPAVWQQQQQQRLAVSITPNELLLNQPPRNNGNSNGKEASSSSSSAINNNNGKSVATTKQQLQDKNNQFLTDSFNSNPDMPLQGPDDGLYHILNKAQHAALLEAASDQIVVLKCFAPWCRACKGLEPKFLQITQDPKYGNLPIVWADLSIQHNKEFVKSLGVLALPTIQFYVAGQLIDTFSCGPSKVPILKRKLAALVNKHVDAKTRQVKPEYVSASAATTAATPAVVAPAEEKVIMTDKQRKLFEKIPYFKEMSIADADDILEHKAVLKTFAPGTVMVREGDPGRSFFVLKKGEVELCRETSNSYADPLVATPPSYLGTVVNVLNTPGDYLGERALITGEPAAASVRASTQVQAWVFDRSAFPASSVLSGQTRGSKDMVSTADDKYGVSILMDEVAFTNKWQEEVVKANQVRGSVNTPELIKGVDTPDDIMEEEEEGAGDLAELPLSMQAAMTKQPTDTILGLLTRFQLIRHVSRCFEYIVQTQATWGDEGIRKRRSMLASRLSSSQRAEFVEAFRLIDSDGDGDIELIELKRVMESIGEEKTDEELSQMITKGSRWGQQRLDARSVIALEDFLGIMAEAEFYHLFRDTFAALDKDDTGYVKAREMCRVLKGVRDLISDDRSRTIIDVEDEEMLIDYEQFSLMLLGSTLA